MHLFHSILPLEINAWHETKKTKLRTKCILGQCCSFPWVVLKSTQNPCCSAPALPDIPKVSQGYCIFHEEDTKASYWPLLKSRRKYPTNVKEAQLSLDYCFFFPTFKVTWRKGKVEPGCRGQRAEKQLGCQISERGMVLFCPSDAMRENQACSASHFHMSISTQLRTALWSQSSRKYPWGTAESKMWLIYRPWWEHSWMIELS